MDEIKQINLEFSLFIRELNSYIQNANEIDDETIKLMTESILAINKLQINSNFRETSTSNDNSFVHNLDDYIFQCRRHIVCCLCHETFPLNSEDFEAHIQKKSHCGKTLNLQSTHQSLNGSPMLRTMSMLSMNSVSSKVSSVIGGPNLDLRTASSVSSVSTITDNDIGDRSKAIPFASVKPTDVNKIEQVLQPSTSGAVDLTCHIETRSITRIKNEAEILTLLTRHLKVFDSTFEVVPFGSATYGFGGSNTNFNILVNTGGSKQSPIVILHELEKSFKLPGVQSEFEILNSIRGDRVHKKRLQFIHKKSGILCWIQFSSNFELAESSQVIRDCIAHTPLCYHLIGYVKDWQDKINDAAALKEVTTSQFNTYIISVLVIFFLQVNRKFPKLTDLPPSQLKCMDHVPKIDKQEFAQAIGQFYEFYGKKYEVNSQLISVNIGRWQERRIPAQQSNFTPEQKRLREGIESAALNWENCSMYVQDIKSPEINITAEVPKAGASSFKQMCQILHSEGLFEALSDAYFSHVETANKSEKMQASNELSNESLYSLQSLKDAISTIEYNHSGDSAAIASTSASAKNNVQSTIVNSNTLSPKNAKLEDFIKVEEAFKSIKPEMDQILSRSKTRITGEKEIIKTLWSSLKMGDWAQTVAPFGSVTLGFGGPKTNLNILIIAALPSISQASFEKYVKNAGLQQDFEFVGLVKANRVQNQQLKIIHKKSGIQCMLLFQTESASLHSEQTTKIILDYISLHPMCKPLIAYVKAWQNVLNEVAAKNGLVAFQFNTYIISVLVIFYLQIKHNLPKINELPSMLSKQVAFSKKEDLSRFVEEFFEFYGKIFERNVHLISVNVGRWQVKSQNGSRQRHFTPEMQSMRNGIKACPANWQNCVMCVQDLVSTRTNITAEIPKQEVDNFIKMCQLFAKHNVPRINTDCSSSTSKVKNEQNINKNDELILKIDKGIADSRISHFLASRSRFELEIVSIFSQYIQKMESSLKLYTFGSTQYGINDSNTNFNFLITTEGEKARNVNRQFFFFLSERTDIDLHFKDIQKIGANRVLKGQISMTHIESGIKCLILFEKDNEIAQSSQIIKRYNKNPICNFLISYIRMWQIVLKQSGSIRFQFNTYIISVLVIFFLQKNHNFPTVEQLLLNGTEIKSNISNHKSIIREFFAFYGNRYQIWNHVISVHIGRWQERRKQPSQTSFSPAQQRLREGMESAPENWTNCTMFVQDLMRPDVNITAEISKDAADNFQQKCQEFAKKLS